MTAVAATDLVEIVVVPNSEQDAFKALLRALLDVPVVTNAWQVTREYKCDDWSGVVAAVKGALSPLHWAVYYAYWFHIAEKCAWSITTKLTSNRLEKVVQLKLDAQGFLQQLPKTCGSLVLTHYEPSCVLAVTVIRPGNYDAQPEYSVTCTRPLSHERVELPCDWQFFVRAIHALRDFTGREDADAAVEEAVSRLVSV